MGAFLSFLVPKSPQSGHKAALSFVARGCVSMAGRALVGDLEGVCGVDVEACRCG